MLCSQVLCPVCTGSIQFSYLSQPVLHNFPSEPVQQIHFLEIAVGRPRHGTELNLLGLRVDVFSSRDTERWESEKKQSGGGCEY